MIKGIVGRKLNTGSVSAIKRANARIPPRPRPRCNSGVSRTSIDHAVHLKVAEFARALAAVQEEVCMRGSAPGPVDAQNARNLSTSGRKRRTA